MKEIKNIIIITLIISLSLALSVQAEAPDFSREYFEELAEKNNKVPHIKTPDYQVLRLENGMTFYLAEDKSLPVVELRGYIEGGKIDEEKKNAGITDLMTELMLLKTENYNQQDLTRFKEINALSLNISASLDRMQLSGNSLKTHSDELLSLLTEVLRNPSFKGSHFNRKVREFKENYKQQFYKGSSLLDMHFFKNLYGDHPYAYNNNYNLILDFLDKAEPAALREFYNKSVNPEDIVIALSGDINVKQVKEKIKSNFADWENNKAETKRDYVWVDQDIHNKVIIVDKKDATQANVRMGYNFYRSKYPKRVPFMMGNRIFGGGSFNSRLMENLRSDKGYVYSVNASTRYNDYGGAYYINLSLAPQKALSGIEAVKDEIKKIKRAEEPFTKEELADNINLYNAVFPRKYKHKIDILDELIYQKEIYNETDDYINDFIAEYNGLKVEDVQEIFAEELYPDSIFTVIVGPKEKILPQFKDSNFEVEVVSSGR